MKLLGIGSDPEVFVTEAGEIGSSIGLLYGTKRCPEACGVGSVQMDNVLAEFNIPPAYSRSQFIGHNSSMLVALRERLKQEGDFDVAIVSSHMYSLDYLRSQGDMAMTLGCEPDLNLYTGKRNPVPDAEQGLRTAAGHIHVSGRGRSGWKRKLVRSMDYFLGLPSVSMDSDTQRRSLYGKAGCYRNTVYGEGASRVQGVEYRVLSNFWLAKPQLMGWAYDQTTKAAAMIDDAAFMEQLETYADLIEQAINGSDAALASEIQLAVGA